MASVVECKVTGLAELQKALEQKPRNIARKILRTVLRKAARVWQLEMKRLAPRLEEPVLSEDPKRVRLSGDLASHIMIKVKVNNDLEGAVQVGPVKRVFWALFNEFGTKKMPAHPFIRPAFDSKKQEVLDVLEAEAKKVLAEETK